jgi:SRSO17 transposase
MSLKDSLPKNNALYEFLSEVDYGVSKNQFNNLYSLTEGLISVQGTKSIRRVSKEILSARGSSAIYRYLKSARWSEDLINRNRITYLQNHMDNNIASNSTGFLIIDDTVNPKKKAKSMEGLCFNHSHVEGKNVWSHCVVTSQFVCNDINLPLDFKLYMNEPTCKKYKRGFLSKPDIAKDFVESFNKPLNCSNVYCLVDSWYSSGKFIKSCLNSKIHLIGSIKSNRLIIPEKERIQIRHFFKSLNLDALDVVTVKESKYKVFECISPLGKTDQIVKVVISFEVRESEDIVPIYLISTDIALSSKDIISFYQERWNIETDYKYLKSYLGFDEYKVRNLRAIERYLLISFLAINLLHLSKQKEHNCSDALGKYIEEFIVKRKCSLVEFIYFSIKNGYELKDIYFSLKLSA